MVLLMRHDHSLIPSNNMLLQLLSLDAELMNPQEKRKAFSSFNTTEIFDDSGTLLSDFLYLIRYNRG